jgi:hypothetical protein
MFVFYFPCVICSIYGFVVPDTVWMAFPTPITTINGNELECQLAPGTIYIVCYAFLLWQFACLWGLSFMVSKIRKSVNEYQENIWMNSIFLFSFLLQLIIYISGYMNTMGGKMFCILSDLICGTVIWALPLANPLFGFIFNQEKYLEKWI